MEQLSNDGRNSFRQQLEALAATGQLEVDVAKAERDAEQIQSDERARQFVEMLQEAGAPTTDLCGFDQIDLANRPMGPGNTPPPKKVFIGRGWVIYPFAPAANRDDCDHPGLILLGNGQSYHTTGRSETTGGYVQGEVYLSGGGGSLGSRSARPENRERAIARAPYSDAYDGLGTLSRALTRNSTTAE